MVRPSRAKTPSSVTTCQPIALSIHIGRRPRSIEVMAELSGDWVYPRFAARNVSISFAVDRSAPAPASVVTFQLPTRSSLLLCPEARRAFMSRDSAIHVLFMPSGAQIRVRTSDS